LRCAILWAGLVLSAEVAVVGAGTGLWLGEGGWEVLLADVVHGEDAFFASAYVLTEPPIVVEKFHDGDVVAWFKVQIARVRVVVAVECDGMCDFVVLRGRRSGRLAV